MSRIIVFGGTFNPVTKAHLAIAQSAMRYLDASKVVFVPTDLSFLKHWKHMGESACFDNEKRVQWLTQAIAKYTNFELLTIEVNQISSTTYETLSYLKHLNPNDEYIFLCGDDKWDEFIHWYNWEELIKNFRFCIVSRHHDKVTTLMQQSNLYTDVWDRFTFLTLDKTYANISSTNVRKAIVNGDKSVIASSCPDEIVDDLYALMDTRDYQTIKVSGKLIECNNGDVKRNTAQILQGIREAAVNGCALVAFSELSLTGASCKDLYYRPYLHDAINQSIDRIIHQMDSGIVALVGGPLHLQNKIYNAIYVLTKCKVVGIVLKQTIPLHQQRYFASGYGIDTTIEFNGENVPVSSHLIFNVANALVCIDVGEDGMAINKASADLLNQGVNLVIQPTCLPYTVGYQKPLRANVNSFTYYNHCAHLIINGGINESSSDYVYDSFIYGCDSDGTLVDTRDSYGEIILDYGKLNYQQSRYTTNQCKMNNFPILDALVSANHSYLPTQINQSPYLSNTISDKECVDIINHQAASLAARLKAISCSKVVIGVSGGLDSTLALIVCQQAFHQLDLDIQGIYAISMPGFGTSTQTKTNGQTLMDLVGCHCETIDIKEAVLTHFKDINQDPTRYDVTYENAQARERTQILMDKANQIGAIVIGTGDMSEIALGWCTYNGDHMSNYGVNASIPKTVMKRLLSAYATLNPEYRDVLQGIIDTPISPELLPSKDNEFAQQTENSVGKYELQDFFMYHYLRNGFNYDKIFAYACKAFAQTDSTAIKNTLDIFYRRFYSQQFKRNCAPEAVDLFDISLNANRGFSMSSDISKAIEFQK